MKAGIFLLAVLAILAFDRPVRAQDLKLRPGLWEHSFILKTGSGQMEQAMGQMQQQLAGLPPEQRKMMEEMMAAQGVKIGPADNSIRVCITEEEAALDKVPQYEGDCRQQQVERTGNTIKVRFDCADPPASGEGEVTLLSPTAYTGKAIINTTVNGQPERLDIQQAGKWLGSDCGNIKPARR